MKSTIEEYKIILVEDDGKKIKDIREFFSRKYGYNRLIVRESYQSGLREIFSNKYDLLLLDMSIPTWDKSPVEPGGNFEKFGGYKILREMQRKSEMVDTILLRCSMISGKVMSCSFLVQLEKVLNEEFNPHLL